MQAYCTKCKKKVEIENPNKVTLKGAISGTCPVCGTKVYMIRKK